TRCYRDWSSDVCSSDLQDAEFGCGQEVLTLAARESPRMLTTANIAITPTASNWPRPSRSPLRPRGDAPGEFIESEGENWPRYSRSEERRVRERVDIVLG